LYELWCKMALENTRDAGSQCRSLLSVHENKAHCTIKYVKQQTIFIHLVVCLTTGPKPLPKRALHILRSGASSFKWEYPLLSLTFWYRSFTFNSNKSPTRCNSFSVYYPDVCLQLNMFRKFSRPSSGAQWLQWQPLVLLSYRGDSRAVFVVGLSFFNFPTLALVSPTPESALIF
jgi:hypothetical protein